MLRKKFILYISLFIFIAGIFSSCYYDYGLDTTNSDVVATFYNKDYNFQNITQYRLIDSVIKVGGNVTNQYDSQILTRIRTNLNSLGWQEVQDSVGAGIISVAAGITTNTIVVTEDYDYWSYWGYSWYYPSYYTYTYTYNTGTLAILMADLSLSSSGRLPIQWSSIINGVADGSNVPSRINTTIDQAFSQSPYLR